ncbi:unnamed protein product [Didymodactylos carnosus]|uniref:J domain-containing protein n=1 Tax=Didymodactylos carnosus TaxID=1234261 RepID=A0A814U9X6_9BILA|nr:unnamed protein product [Didymodactylos carnosus]CAF1331711.1 unnamed protein product [Didymodactylos carnosus]CAF3936310.1 unnamed protein product [Didymodactylos carnosus]CAF4143024.1 unnamed protein product [Didymodactylos carnosus]
MGDKSPYEVLGVDPKAKDLDLKLKLAYRDKIHLYLQNSISKINFKLLNRAYECLADHDARQLYNETKQWTNNISLKGYTIQQMAVEELEMLKVKLDGATIGKINSQHPVTGHTSLYCAARAGQLEAVKWLVETGSEPDLSQRTKSTALHVASFYGHKDVVRWLLQSGANYNVRNTYNNIPKSEAYDDEIVKVFTELEKDWFVQASAGNLDYFRKTYPQLNRHIDEQNYLRRTLLNCVSRKGYIELVKLFVEQYNANLDIVDSHLNSPLHVAASNGHEDVVKYLLDCGANPTLRNKWATTAEDEAINFPNVVQLFKLMKQRDASKMAENGTLTWFAYYFQKQYINKEDSTGSSLLFVACRNGHLELVKWLIENGANVNFQQTVLTKSTPLHVASYRKHVKVVEFLLLKGANVNTRNAYGHTPADEETTDEIRTLILIYKTNRLSEKNLYINLFSSRDLESVEPAQKLQLEMTTTIDSVIGRISDSIKKKYPDGMQLSIARRPLRFPSGTTLLDAVYKVRYIAGFLVDLPLCLVVYGANDELPQVKLNHNMAPRGFIEEDIGNYNYKVSKSDIEQTIEISDKISIEFASNSVENTIEFSISFLNTDNAYARGLKSCECMFLFKTKEDKKFVQPPTMIYKAFETNHITSLYVFTQKCWFTHRNNKIMQSNACYAIVQEIEIVPNELHLNADMFATGRLESKNYKMIKCLCLKIKDRNEKHFSKTAYHGTTIQAIKSILTDGLVIPGTVTATGKRINPPNNHIARDMSAFNIPDFAGGIFVSPSIYYSSDPTYAIQFQFHDQLMVPVLEVGVRANSYTTFPSTVSDYNLQDDDDPQELEWRIANPMDTEIINLLFIPVTESISISKNKRKKRIAE